MKQSAEVKKVKSLLFFCPAPVARPLLPPLSGQSCSPGERAGGKCTKALCGSPLSVLLCKLTCILCAHLLIGEKKDAAYTKEARIQP